MKKSDVLEIERHGVTYEAPKKHARRVKKMLVNPLINYLPKRFLLWLFRSSKSPLLKECLVKAGSWKTMRISYENKPHVDLLDKFFLTFGTFPMGLRNRKRLVVKKLVECIEKHDERPLHIMGVGAGPGTNAIEALGLKKDQKIFAKLLDIDSAAFDHGRELARKAGLSEEQVSFIEGNAIELEKHLSFTPHIVKMIGIIEYLTDEQVQALFDLAYRVLPKGGHVVVNSISNSHGHDRFMRRVFNLHLNYRTPNKVMQMLSNSRFSQFDVNREPLKIYHVLVGEKK